MKIGLIFPGQGAQRVGMGAELAAAFPSARLCFEEASDALGFDLLALCGQGPEETLGLTEYTQPAILTVSVAAYRVWQERHDIKPLCAAGHSLGEYSALVAAGAIPFADAVRTVRIRGQAMQEAVPVGVGAMAAVLGIEAGELAAVCQEAAGDEVVSPANFNAPGQIVISGHAGAVRRAGELAKTRGAKRILPLGVSAPFHCDLMQPAALRLAVTLSSIRFAKPRFPVFANVNALPYPDSEPSARELLVEQVCAPVRWEQCVEAIAAQGATHTLECGPGKVTSAMVKRIAPGLTLLNVEKPSDLETPVVAG